MSDTWVNIRFGIRHFQVGRRFAFVRFEANKYHIENEPSKYFEVYEFFGLV